MNYDSDPGKGALQALRVPHIADEITQAGPVKSGNTHVVLFKFVTAEDDQLLRAVFAQHQFDELSSERPRPAGDQYDLFGPVHRRHLRNEKYIRKRSRACERAVKLIFSCASIAEISGDSVG